MPRVTFSAVTTSAEHGPGTAVTVTKAGNPWAEFPMHDGQKKGLSYDMHDDQLGDQRCRISYA